MSDNKSYEIVLDRYLKYRNSTPVFTQFDTDTSELTFKFLSNGSSYDIPYTRLVLIVNKPDGKVVNQIITEFSSNTARVVLLNQALTTVGKLKCQIEMYDAVKLESTCEFEIEVRRSLNDGSRIESENEYQVLQQLILDVDGSIDKMNKATDSAIKKNNQALIDALAQIDESELVRLKELIELLQQGKLGIEDKAADSSKLNGVSDDVNATPNSVAKRDGTGDLAVATAIIFKGRGSMGIDPDKGYPVFKDSENNKYDTWNEKNVPIESGSFTPVCKQQGGASWTMDTSISFGRYYRFGDMIYIHGRARTTAKPNVTSGKFIIDGLPFTVNTSGQTIDLGIHSGLIYHTDARELKIYLQSGYRELQFYYVRTEYSYQVHNCDLVKPDVDIYFSGWYRCIG